MKIVIIGGHLAPSLSVLQSLPKNAEILFVGRKYGLEGDNALSLEYRTINALNIPFVGLNTGRLQRKLTKYTIPSLFKLPLGIIKSFLILIKFRPQVVLGFGGYVSIPVVFCAYILRIPVIIHEQTLEAGFANRFLSRFAAKICISWDSSRKYFPKEKTILTGNPVRNFSPLISHLSFNNKLPTIYVTGGSSGSHFINVLMERCIKELLPKYNVIHQTGNAQEFHDFEKLAELRKTLPFELSERYHIEKFIDPDLIGSILKKADLVVSRSGMNTITELLYFEKPSLLIPLPFSQNNEQFKNARFLEKLGLGKVLQQAELDPKKLYQAIEAMFKNIKNYRINNAELKNRPVKNAVQNILSVINYVAKIKTEKKI